MTKMHPAGNKQVRPGFQQDKNQVRKWKESHAPEKPLHKANLMITSVPWPSFELISMTPLYSLMIFRASGRPIP